MAPLIDLPAELLARILTDTLLVSRDAPACPSEDQDRTRLTNSAGVWIRTQRLENPALPLLLVNRLINKHVKAITAIMATGKSPQNSTGKSPRDYELDVMFVKKAGLWPTWTSVPVLTQHVHTVHVTFRIFNPAPDLDPKFEGSGLLGSGLVGSGFARRPRPHPGVWNFYHLLTSFLQGSPRARSAANPGEATCRYTIKNLVIDVLSPPEDEDHTVTGPGEVLSWATTRVLLPLSERNLDAETFPRHRRTARLVLPLMRLREAWPPLPSHPEPQIKPAEKLELFLRHWIGNLLTIPREPDNATILYEGILDCIELRVDGQVQYRFGVEDALRVATPRSWLIVWEHT
ncbi:hypothetical protein IMZ48_42110 [Candidatus Bathyarchaeota archaeon]|nr:hypothetical protein [Candidatus Bathyarchaeota archaeon]